MKRQMLAWQLSLGLHLLLIGTFVLTSTSLTTTRRPVLIDFSTVTMATLRPSPLPALPRPQATVRPKVQAPAEKKLVAAPPPLLPASATPEEQAPVPASQVIPVPATENITTTETMIEPSLQNNVSTGEAPGREGQSVAESGTSSVAEKEEIYRREHFTYIRHLIMNELGFPPLARRMGWSGQVIVSFRVIENGCIENLKVVKGSGRSILDQNALATINRVAPFPRPPVAAEIVMPIVYLLN